MFFPLFRGSYRKYYRFNSNGEENVQSQLSDDMLKTIKEGCE